MLEELCCLNRMLLYRKRAKKDYKMRYIGGKSLLLDSISEVINDNCADAKSVLDIFSGSGVVSQHFAQKGYEVASNDFLYFSYVIARGTIGITSTPTFNKLNIEDVFGYLNDLKIEDTIFSIEDCFVYQNYSPTSTCERMYFQNDNALKIDIIRMQIEEWKNCGLINDDEYYYLLAALINAVPYVANITGTFGAYLKYWDKRTYNKLELIPYLVAESRVIKCVNKDYTEALNIKTDVLYADPPYNTREYLPNYHVMETIARYDYPAIKGVTGIRNYENQKSLFCRKNNVSEAFEVLIRDAKAKYILISYNNEGLISTEALSNICRKYAVDNSFRLYEYNYRRYKNKISNNKEGLKEQLYFLRRY